MQQKSLIWGMHVPSNTNILMWLRVREEVRDRARCSYCNTPMASERSKCPNCGRDHYWRKDPPGVDRRGYETPRNDPPGVDRRFLDDLNKPPRFP